MPRSIRLKSSSGFYHVMLRGINRQHIFEVDSDFVKFQQLLYKKCFPEDQDGSPMPECCVIYAYCLMPNHVHLLIQQKNESVSDIIKCIAISYAQHYNTKYDHSGHVFQDRFKSEPVDNINYFITLLRYIHQNPVAGGLSHTVDGYRWSSWQEYINPKSCVIAFCATQSVYERVSRDQLIALVNDPMPKMQKVLDFDNTRCRRMSDERIREYLQYEYGIENPMTVQWLDKKKRNELIRDVCAFGASARQLSRIIGVSSYIIRKLTRKNCNNGDGS